MTRASPAPAHTDWLHHHLTIGGPEAELDAFGRAAAGSGLIPWVFDLDRMEEDWFNLVAASSAGSAPTLSLDGARLLTADLRDAVARRHALATARVGISRACSFDLHCLVPVPTAILRLGPDHPDGLDWLWAHWGTTAALRAVHSRKSSGPRKEQELGEPALRLSFWSADWTPWRAFATIRRAWPALRFDVEPVYAAA